MADSGESPEAPQPREMIDLEVSGITNTRMIGSIYITTMLVIKLNWKNAQQKHKIKLQAVQTIWNQKKISTMKCDPFTIDWLTSHCEAALRQEQQQQCIEIDIFYRIRFFLLFLLSAYSLFDIKKKAYLTDNWHYFIHYFFVLLSLSLSRRLYFPSHVIVFSNAICRRNRQHLKNWKMNCAKSIRMPKHWSEIIWSSPNCGIFCAKHRCSSMR